MGARVVLICDRGGCDAEELRSDSMKGKWTEHVIHVGPETQRAVQLCPKCTRELQLFFDGAKATPVADERDRVAAKLRSQLLDETPTNVDPDPLAQARDAGYRGGWNDRSRSLAKELSPPQPLQLVEVKS
jgi:hypothetical protein